GLDRPPRAAHPFQLMSNDVMSGPATPVLVLDDGEAANLDGLATSVAVFGRGQLALHYATDLDDLRSMSDELAARRARGVVVVDADHCPAPKALLADAADLGFPLAVLSDGRGGRSSHRRQVPGQDRRRLSQSEGRGGQAAGARRRPGRQADRAGG